MRTGSNFHTFSGVAVGLPSKVRGSEAEEEWQEVDWQHLSSGEMSVEGDSFLLVFKPEGKAKALGNLIRAGTSEDERTLVVTTDDAITKLYRFTFSSVQGATDFLQLAGRAEAAFAATAHRGAEASAPGRANPRAAELAKAIQEKYVGQWPLVFGSMELYGPDPSSGGAGSEVLLGSGALVLLDPEDEPNRVGQYSLLFFGEDEGASHPVTSFPIGPKMMLTRQKPDVEDCDGPAATFELVAGAGLPVHSIAFDEAATAAAFARDFRVRSRLMDVSLKTVKGKQATNQARDELKELRRQSLGARLRRYMTVLVVLFLFGIVARVGMLYAETSSQAPEMYVQQVTKDLGNIGQISHSVAMYAGTKVCSLAVGAVAVVDLQKCIILKQAQVRECVAKLMPSCEADSKSAWEKEQDCESD